MTVASEIERLQCAKADICTAIENKGVTVGDITLDEYACCIDNIPTGISGICGFVDFLLVGGGGSGAYRSGGGGGGGVLQKPREPITSSCCKVCVGAAGGCSIFGTYLVYPGGNGATYAAMGGIGCGGGSGGGGFSGYCGFNVCDKSGGRSCYLTGHEGGYSTSNSPSYWSGGGGGGAGGPGGYGHQNTGGNGGAGFSSVYSGEQKYYAGGGGGYGNGVGGTGGTGGGGNGSCGTCYSCPGNYYGGGGGGGGANTTPGCQGIVIVRYKTDGSCGIHCATGGTVYTCGDYTIHCFTTVGESAFCIVC